VHEGEAASVADPEQFDRIDLANGFANNGSG
jgi:hypothetical protein